MAYLALYRLYRPRNFQQIAGQDHITRTLKNQVRTDRIGHAYLFSGARGTGKTSTAKVFSRAVNCLSPNEGEPCGECEICKTPAEDLSMDILEIDAASNNGVDEIRDLREKISFAPAVCKYKVYIIDEVHMLSTGAFNALLKTLEEPPAHAVFILATTELQKLPATILSRCQRFDFKRIPETVIIQQLEQVAEQEGAQCDPDALSAVAHAAGGGMRDALSILDQCLGYSSGRLTYDDVAQVLGAAGAGAVQRTADAVHGADARQCMQMVDDVYNGGADMAVFTRELVEYFRRDMMRMAGEGEAGLALRAVTELSRAEASMRYSPQPRVTLEAALVRLCIATEEQDVSALMERIERLEATLRAVQDGSQPIAGAQPVAAAEPVSEPGEDTPPWDAEPKQQAEERQPRRPEPAAAAKAEQQQPEPEPAEAPTQSDPAQPAAAGGDAKSIYKEMMSILRREAIATHGFAQFGKLHSLQDDVLTIAFEKEDEVMATGLKMPRNAKLIDGAATQAAGRPLHVNCVVGKAEAPAPPPAKDEGTQQNMLEQVKDVFGMDVEIED